jgi:glycosyltransferase involved in cell wall biosynthesis
MRILFLSHYFPPEVNAPATRTHEHCREWARAGHEVHVITCVPSHPAGVAFPGYRSGWYRRDEIDGIIVHRIWTCLAANAGIFRRTLNFLSFVPTAVWRALRLGSFDVIIGTSPQFFCAVAAWLSALATRTPWIFELRDLWPESIAAVGAARWYMPIALLARLELRMYRHARAVVCVSRSFISHLQDRGVDRSKLSFVPNGINPEFWRGGDRDAGRRELGVGAHDVLVTYVGTVGMAHDLGTVLAAAKRLKDSRRDIRLAIVGDGAELGRLRQHADDEGLTNVTFTGLVARERIPDYLAASEISLVTLKRSDVFKTVLPSKMFESMAASRPMLLAVDGEAKETLARAGGGISIAPGDADALVQGIVTLANDAERRRAMGVSGALFVEREFSRRTWAERYLVILDGVRAITPGNTVRQPSEALDLS